MSEKPQVPYLRYVAAACFVIAGLWAMYIMENYFGVTIRGRKIGPDGSKIAFWMPLAAMPIVIAGTWYLYQRAKALVSNGIEVIATIVEISTISMRDMKDITFKYTWKEQPYEQKKSVEKGWAKSLCDGDEITVIINPDKPKHCIVKEML